MQCPNCGYEIPEPCAEETMSVLYLWADPKDFPPPEPPFYYLDDLDEWPGCYDATVWKKELCFDSEGNLLAMEE